MTKGKCISGKYLLLLLFKKTIVKNSNFLGLAISTKKVCKAVGRNRLKRLIRESYFWKKKRFPDGYSIVFFCGIKRKTRKCIF